MTDKQKSRSLFVIAIVAIVNAIGYGIIIPIQYAYVARFGINTFMVGVLFASYSLAQFLSTPIIGRLSDRFGRKALLAYSMAGTTLSFALFAFAPNALFIFIARILDGISGGNISVAQAVISDVSTPKERAKWYGILGASFGFGFVVGPAMGGLLSNISLQAPFYFAAVASLISTLLVLFVLKETLPKGQREQKPVAALFDFRHLVHALFEPYVGLVLIGTFIASFAFSVFILGFQAFTNDVLKLSASNISLLFVIFGVVGLIMQGFAIGKLVAWFGEVKLLILGTIMCTASFVAMGFSSGFHSFIVASIFLAIGNSFLTPLLSALLSKHTRPEDQGGIMGINQAYVSLASIIGPVIGGALAVRMVSDAFFGAAIALGVMVLLTFIIARESGKHVIDL